MVAITKVSYARLYNLGNYENERFEVKVTVEDGDVTTAQRLAVESVEAERARLVAARDEAEQRRRRAEWEATEQRRREEARMGHEAR